MSNKLDFREVKPASSTLKLSGAKDQIFLLRPMTIDDEIWIENNIGIDAGHLLEKGTIVSVFRAVFHLLEDSSKAFFASRSVTVINENGDEATLSLGGYRLLLALAQGMSDRLAVNESYLDSMGITKEVREKFEKAKTDEEKKTLKEPELIGNGHLTSSQANTAGRQNISLVEQGTKSDGDSRLLQAESTETEHFKPISQDVHSKLDNSIRPEKRISEPMF